MFVMKPIAPAAPAPIRKSGIGFFGRAACGSRRAAGACGFFLPACLAVVARRRAERARLDRIQAQPDRRTGTTREGGRPRTTALMGYGRLKHGPEAGNLGIVRLLPHGRLGP